VSAQTQSESHFGPPAATARQRGPIPIVGAVGGLGWMMAPVLIDEFAHWLSTGTLRRR